MQVYIDVEDASRNKYGDGPILTATNWQSTRRLDAAGTFSFEMPASDPRSEYLRNKRIVRCWSSGTDGVVERGAGIIDSIEVLPNPRSPTMLKVSGDDMLRELTYRDVGYLNLFDEIQEPATVTLSGNPVTLPEYIDLDTVSTLEIASSEPFDRIDFAIVGWVNYIESLTRVQYFNETSARWVELTVKENTTYTGEIPFAQSGHISFDIPAAWGTQDDAYQIRISCQQDIGRFRLTVCEVHRILETEDGLAMLMLHAPDGWSLDAAGFFATQSNVNYAMPGGSVLTGLRRLAEQTGEHFRLGVSDRRVHWLGRTIASSGLQAIAASESFPRTMLITALRQTSDTYDLFTRAYFYGGGEGANRLTLAATSRTAPEGYILNAAASYIERIDAVSEYGRIDALITFSDIVPIDISMIAKRNAADTLFDRGIQTLSRRSQLHTAYEIEVVPSSEMLMPGQTIHVRYDEWFEGYHAVAIHGDMVVLEVTHIITAGGIATAKLVVGTIDAYPWNDNLVLAESLANIQTDKAKRVPQAALTSSDWGTPTYIATENGMVVGLRKVSPVADGSYDMRSHPWITFSGGIAIAVDVP